MANIRLPHTEPYAANLKKDGEYYDDCINPACGQREVERRFKIGGTAGSDAEFLDASMYSCDPRAGGCGQAWARTTKQGLDFDHARGISPKWLTRSAARGTAHSAPSEQFRANYDLIQWDK